jgi:hypothetical protein
MTFPENTVLEAGSKGPAVETLQRLLKTNWGFDLSTDGEFGPKTEAVVKTFQSMQQLPITGICDSATLKALEAPPVKSTLENVYTLESAAKQLGCAVAAIRAVSEVESAGSGFLAVGLPKILFERHWFYKRLKHYGIPIVGLVEKYPDICNPKPGGYKGGASEHNRLEQACKIHRPSALESASWGAYQIMGFHWEPLGYSSVEDFVSKMCDNESWHLEAFVRFIENDSRLLKAIRAKDWLTFARGYNGPAQKGYDQRMAKAYQKYA